MLGFDSHENNYAGVFRSAVDLKDGTVTQEQVKPYDYTKQQNISDAQKSYEENVNEKRGIPKRDNCHNVKNSDKTNSSIVKSLDSDDKLKTTIDSRTLESKQNKTVYISQANIWRGADKDEIERREIDLSELYEESARGGKRTSEMALEFSASEEDIRNLLETRGLLTVAGRRFKISNKIKNTTDIVGTYLYETTTSGTDFGQGMRMTREMSTPVLWLITDRAKISMVNAMKKNAAIRINSRAAKHNVFGKNAVPLKNPELGVSTKELFILQKELIKNLQNAGHGSFAANSGIVMQNRIDSYLLKNTGKLSVTEKEAFLMLRDIAKIRTLDDSITKGRYRFKNKLRVKVMRYMQQCDAGLGIVFTYNLIRRGIQTLRLGLKLTRTTLKTVQIAGKLAMHGSAKLAAKVAKTKLAQKLKQTEAGKKAVNGVQLVKNGASKASSGYQHAKNMAENTRMGKMMHSFKERHQRFQQFRRDPFSLKARRTNLLQNLSKTKVGRVAGAVFSPVNALKRMLGYLTAGLMSLASALISVLMMLLVAAFILMLIVAFITAVISAIAGLFDFSTSEEEIRKAAFETIKKQYEAQNEQIQNLYNQYRTVTVNYEEIRDQNEYQKEEHQPSVSFVETTNSAELLSMAVVYFDFDLEDAGKNKVCDYIKKLYNGSHQITLIENSYTYKDEKGKEYTVRDANVTLTTYYFNSLFECQLMDNAGITGESGGILAGTEVSEQVWNYFRSAGFSEHATAGIMGNMYQESGMNPSTIQGGGRGPAAGICQWENYNTKSGRWKNLDNYAKGQGNSWTDLKCQLDFLMAELKGADPTTKSIMDKRYGGLSNFKKATDITWAVEAFEKSFERAGKPNMPRRINQANAYYNMYHGREIVKDEKQGNTIR